MRRFLPDSFTLILIATVVLASVFPATGRGASFMLVASNVAIALLFFLHGARLSTQAIVAGVKDLRLHALILACTFLLFPALGLALRALFPGLLTPSLWLGVLFVCTLSSTVQSSIALTSMARGNIPGAICAATASNLLGTVLTPLLVALLLHRQGGGHGLADAGRILLQLLVPFAAGSLLRPWIGAWAQRNNSKLAKVDRSSILLAVYTAFSEAVAQGIWHTFPAIDMAAMVLVNAVLLGSVLLITTWGARRLGLSKENEITLVFCGSKKSLASGIPLATVLFGTAQMGVVVLPLMIFHQMQLMVCAVLARRYAERPQAPQAEASSSGRILPAGRQ
ncbi:bile acid:sodium symporter [Achromobacter sp. HZ01]|uniref:bile acid:sodium symporter family protein n=1 Tax=Achromobacter sp. HZ01 TaxID=1416886 RepID=UPI000DC306CB|nr:bile acid:sodium symporter family protein [Achromobacter sp. HZ01]MBO9328184.1 bile acid:sodium symporter [Achromobacter xylosoxidans]RAP65960.1 bile acid:sodium symporter [Achromobacter sp. HZ01]